MGGVGGGVWGVGGGVGSGWGVHVLDSVGEAHALAQLVEECPDGLDAQHGRGLHLPNHRY